MAKKSMHPPKNTCYKTPNNNYPTIRIYNVILKDFTKFSANMKNI